MNPDRERGPVAETTLPERPALFVIGVALVVIKACLWLALMALAWLALAIGIAIWLGEVHQDERFVPILVGGLVSVVLAGFALFQALVLLVACMAWSGRRAWIYALLVVAILHIASANPVGIVVGLLVLIGCVQWIDRPEARLADGPA